MSYLQRFPCFSRFKVFYSNNFYKYSCDRNEQVIFVNQNNEFSIPWILDKAVKGNAIFAGGLLESTLTVPLIH